MSAEQDYLFRHAMVREAAYGLQPPEQRAQLHAEAVDAFEAVLADDQLAPYLEELADHASFAMAGGLDGGLKQREREFVQRAAALADADYRMEDAARLFLRLAGLQTEPSDSCSAWLSYESVCLLSGKHADAENAIECAQEFAELSGVLADKIAVMKSKAWLLARYGEPAASEQLLRQAINLASETDDPKQRAGLLNDLGASLRVLGRAKEGVEVLTEALELAREHEDPVRCGTVLGNLSTQLYALGELEEAQALVKEAIQVAEKHGPKHQLTIWLMNWSSILRTKGESAASEQVLLRGIDIAREIGDRGQLATGLGNLALIQMDNEDLPTAESNLQEALAITRERGTTATEATHLGNLGALAQRRGQFDRAAEFFEEALRLCRASGMSMLATHWLASIAAIDVDQKRFEKALPQLDQAIKESSEHGNAYLHGMLLGFRAIAERGLGLNTANETWRKADELLAGKIGTRDYHDLREMWETGG